jgi:hypothetical protein
MHPSTAGLIAFCDAQAGSARRHRIANHLSKCGKCRGELRRIQSEKDELSTGGISGAAKDLEAGLAELLSSMGAWQDGRTVVLASGVKRGVRSQLELYLGSPAVSLMERPGMPAEELLANACEILHALLGPAAAAAVRDEMLGGLDCARQAAETDR